MDILKRHFSFKTLMLLTMVLMSVMSMSSCSKDDEPKNSGQQTEKPTEKPTTSNELVGTWYFTYNGDTDYDDYFIFRADGTGLYHYDDEQSDDFTYTYDSSTKILALNFKHWESERFPVEWLGNNAIELGDYGKYVRRQ